MAKCEAIARGVDHLVDIPFTTDEIIVRTVASIVRATGREIEIRQRCRLGRFEFDLLGPELRLDDSVVRLTLLERTLLYLFLAHPGETLTREEILTSIWGKESSATSNVIDRHVRDIRVKLQERWREPRFIATDTGRGYRFVSETGIAKVEQTQEGF